MAAKRVEIYQEPDENVPEIARELYLVRVEGGKSLGYRTDIITENLSERVLALLVCKRCQGILRDACLSNGEQFCSCCTRKGEQKHQNADVSKTVLSLKSSCPLYKRGCEWLGTLGECEDHLNVCGYVHEKCKLGYEIVLPRHELNIHMKDKCLYRKIPCEHCKHDFKFCDMLIHQAKCPKVRLKCKEGCGTTVDREKMAQHLKKDCGRVIEECKLGCGIELPRDELDMHVNTKCVERMIPCEYCHIDFKACDMSNHNKKCKKMPLSCELGCGTVAYREDMARHLEKECVEKKVECPFIKYKCEVGLIKRKELKQHLKEKRTEHTELKLSAMEEIVMQQSKMIAIQNGQFQTLLSITNTTKLEWRIHNVVNFLKYCTPSTSQQFQVDRFTFTLQLINGSIYIHYPRQELSKVKVKFIFRMVSPSNPDVTWEAKSSIIEIKQKGSDSYRIDIAKIPAREEFIRDNIDLEIFVTLL